jgi:methanethiol S-methyltransferase
MAKKEKIIIESIPFTANLIGRASQLLFIVFLFNGSLPLVRFGFSESGVLVWDALLSVIFFAQHSVMIRKGFRIRLSHAFASLHHGAFFAVSSGIVLTAVIILWQSSGIVTLELQGLPRILVRGVFFLGLAGIVWVLYTFRFKPIGTSNAAGSVSSGETSVSQELTLKGPYLWVRHPLYSSMILMIWSCPDVTADRLLLAVLWTIWIVFGAFLEEKDLSEKFGAAYRQYQQTVPMLIPIGSKSLND